MRRLFDFGIALAGCLALSPVFALVAILVRLSSPGPVLFRQTRVGLGGRDFAVLKFRTMTVRPDSAGGSFDAGDSSRVTRIGRVLRASKLDELPQLWNVVRGDMALVGPRPEVRKWVLADPARWALVHTLKPGITDPTSILYRNEERLLAAAPDPERLYREEILPRKLDLYLDYLRTRSFVGDLRILWETAVAVAPGSRPARPRPLAADGVAPG